MGAAVGFLMSLALLGVAPASPNSEESRSLSPEVEAEQELYHFVPFKAGTDPLWCRGSTCLVRIGKNVFASGIETIPDVPPLNNLRWLLFAGTAEGWQLLHRDTHGRTAEPCPLVAIPTNNQVLMSLNPTLLTDVNKQRGPARPAVAEFSARNLKAPPQIQWPAWSGNPSFHEHSYRSFAADGSRGEAILIYNIYRNNGWTHAEWALRDRRGKWVAQGQLPFPRYEDPRYELDDGIHCRVSYPTVVLKNRAVHICGLAAHNKWDRVKDNPELMGRLWGFRWRRLLYTWTPNIGTTPFKPWVEIGNCFHNGGYLFQGDMWLAPNGRVHIVWMENPMDRQLRDRHFPDIKLAKHIQYATVEGGRVVTRQTLFSGGEGLSGEAPQAVRFHTTPGNRLFVVYYVAGADQGGKRVHENRIAELLPDGTLGKPITLPLKYPLDQFFTATPRAGSAPSVILDMLGYRANTELRSAERAKSMEQEQQRRDKAQQRARDGNLNALNEHEEQGEARTVSYARVRLW